MVFLEEIKILANVLGISLDTGRVSVVPDWIIKLKDTYSTVSTHVANWTKIFSLTELTNTYGTHFGKIFSLSEFSTAWSSYLNKIFSLTEFNSSWSSTLNKIFSFRVWILLG